jgi:hypothetical protein
MGTAVRRIRASSLLMLALVTAAACSPGTLPSTPSLVTVGGGGARYNGTITTRRLPGGNFTIVEGVQSLSLSLTVRGTDQINGRLEAGGSTGSLTGTLTGNLASGSFQATLLISTPAQQGGTAITCEGRGDVSGTLSGLNLVFNAPSVTYGNCPGLTTTSQGQAVAVSPIPGSTPNRANVVISILGGTRVARGTCASGLPGFPFTVEIAETNGINVTLDPTFIAEERHGGGSTTTSTVDMPFTDLAGGTRRTYDVCSLTAGTYQAFFTGTDGAGNRITTASPVVTFG